jgi:V/A-type H+-transporting ATPase subunit E
MSRGDRKSRGERPPDPPEDLDPGESTLESFVARLHDEGVQAGRQEAERLVREARREAERIVERAQREAERLANEAREKADRDLARGRDELDLAARDAVLELTEAFRSGLRAVLEEKVEHELRDPDFLRTLVAQAVSAYAQADAERSGAIDVRVPRELEADLESWAVGELARGLEEGNALTLSPTLAEAGFEYRVSDGTVEVTVESTVDLLMRLLTPRLGEVLERAAQDLPR